MTLTEGRFSFVTPAIVTFGNQLLMMKELLGKRAGVSIKLDLLCVARHFPLTAIPALFPPQKITINFLTTAVYL